MITVRITPTIAHEYALRQPDYLPWDRLAAGGTCTLSVAEARALLSDAGYNCDPAAFDVGPYDMPLGVFNAYRALARNLSKALKDAA